MKKYKFIIVLIVILIYSQLSSQSQWITNSIPFTGQNQRVNDASFVNADVGYVNVFSFTLPIDHLQPIKIYKTTNKGVNWISKGDLGSGVYSNTPPAMKFVNENTGFIALVQKDNNNIYRAVIYKTTDGCISWNSVTINDISLTISSPVCKFEFINESTGYLSTLYNVYQTTNSGVSWIQRTNNSLNAMYVIFSLKKSEINSNIIYAAGGKYDQIGLYNIPVILRSLDGGVSFQTIVDETNSNGIKGIFDMSIVNNNGTDVLKLVYRGGIAEYSNSHIFDLIHFIPNVSAFNFIQFWNYKNGVLGVNVSINGGSTSEERIIKTTDGGSTWDMDNYEYAAGTKGLQGFHKIGDVFCTTSYIVNGNSNEYNTFFHVRKININLIAKSNYVTNTPNITMQFAGNNYTPLPYYNVEIMGGSNNASVDRYPAGIEDVFYKWDNNNMNPYLSFAGGNPYYIDKGEVTANYKSKNIADNTGAINNANQTKAIRDTTNLNNNPLNLIHQVHESMGGIFYSRSTDGGSNFQREEVVNYNEFTNDVFGNRNPSITVKRIGLNPMTYYNQNTNVATVWERYNQNTNNTDIIVTERVSNIQNNGYEWKRYDDNTASYKFASFPSSSEFQSTPKLFVYSPLQNSNLYNSALVVPHLEKDGINTKVIVSIRYQSHSYDLLVDEGNIKNLAVSSPYNYYGIFGLHMVYQKDNSVNNIVYKKINAGWDYLTNSIQHDVVETVENLGYLDGMRARFTPDISVQNGLPVVTYCGNYYDNRIIHYEDETVSDNMISLLKHTTITRIKTTNNGAWSEYERFTGLNPQENPNVEGSKNAMAYLLSFRKNDSYFQFVKINGLSQYYCNPGSYSETDAKFVRGSYIGQFGSTYNPLLLTLSNPDANSRYTIGQRPFSISNIAIEADGFDNLDGIIEKDNMQYSLTLGPIIACNTTSNNSTTVGFADDSPPQTVHNPVEFNETMISAVFSLSNNDTLIIGANGKYTSAGQSLQPLKYHVNLVNSNSGQIHRELFRDTINVEDSVGIEFLRGYVINRIEKGTDQFYVQMVVDTVDTEDANFGLNGVYADNTPPQGDAPHSYKTKVFFENGSNPLTNIGNQLPTDYSLSQNYPNPFNPTTTIKFALPKDGFVTMKVYDITGREVERLVSEVKKAGYHTVQFNT